MGVRPGASAGCEDYTGCVRLGGYCRSEAVWSGGCSRGTKGRVDARAGTGNGAGPGDDTAPRRDGRSRQMRVPR